jgi:hypothetical protein
MGKAARHFNPMGIIAATSEDRTDITHHEKY